MNSVFTLITGNFKFCIFVRLEKEIKKLKCQFYLPLMIKLCVIMIPRIRLYCTSCLVL